MRIEAEIVNINDNEILMRNASEEDAELVLKYLKTVHEETPFLMRDPEEIVMTIEDERNFINQQNESDSSVMMLGFINGEHAGNCSLHGSHMNRYKHRVSLSIALYQKYTGMGVGRAMIEKMVSYATEQEIKQIELEVVTENKQAIALYENLGFTIIGTLPNSTKYKDGTYVDSYWMVKTL